jgi:hypothetical protein
MGGDLYDMSHLERNHTFRKEMVLFDITEFIAAKMAERKWDYPDLAKALQIPVINAEELMNHNGSVSVSLLVKIGLVFDCRVVVNFVHLGTDVTKPVPDTGGKNAV